MEEFLTNLATPYWWISVVVVGLILGVLAHYIPKGLDALLGRVLKRFQERSAKSKARREKIITAMVAYPEEFNYQLSLWNYAGHRATSNTVFMFAMVLGRLIITYTAVLPFWLIASLDVVFYFSVFFFASSALQWINYRGIVSDAMKRIRQARQEKEEPPF